MKKKRYVLIISVFMLIQVLSGNLWAQIQSEDDIVFPGTKTQDLGAVSPYFWIGIKSVFGAGYNLQNQTGGFRNVGGDNHTYASFNVMFVDSQYNPPNWLEIGNDRDVWSGSFTLVNYTTKLNSWSGDIYHNRPAWLAEISGKGLHLGFFSQAGAILGFIDDQQGDAKPLTAITGGNKVVELAEKDELGKTFYPRSTSHATKFSTDGSKGGVMYVGYDQPDLFDVYLTMLSQGDVTTDKGGKQGIAAVLDFRTTPLGVITNRYTPFTIDIAGNVIAGANFKGVKDNLGFGLKAEPAIFIRKDWVLSPIVAFDGKLDVNNKFDWKAGGGLTFRFSPMRWSSDTWGELQTITGYEKRYQNNQILKYAYAQVYATYSEDTDLDLAFKFEEPDGTGGFNEQLGAAAELRLYNLNTEKIDWSARARVSYELMEEKLAPYLRVGIDSNSVLKIKGGIEANLIPYTGFELGYTSPNINAGAKGVKQNIGTIEFVIVLQSDSLAPRSPKSNDWFK